MPFSPLALAAALAAALTAALTGCLPAAPGPGEPLVAVINGPAEGRLIGLASAFEREAEAVGTPGFAFARGNLVRFQELRRNFVGSRADDSAARLARSLGADAALMLGAPTLERRVTPVLTTGTERRRVETTLRVEAVLVEADTAARLGTLRSRTYLASRVEASDEPLPSVQDDPDLIELADLAVADLTPALVAMLRSSLPATRVGVVIDVRQAP